MASFIMNRTVEEDRSQYNSFNEAHKITCLTLNYDERTSLFGSRRLSEDAIIKVGDVMYERWVDRSRQEWSLRNVFAQNQHEPFKGKKPNLVELPTDAYPFSSVPYLVRMLDSCQPLEACYSLTIRFFTLLSEQPKQGAYLKLLRINELSLGSWGGGITLEDTLLEDLKDEGLFHDGLTYESDTDGTYVLSKIPFPFNAEKLEIAIRRYIAIGDAVEKIHKRRTKAVGTETKRLLEKLDGPTLSFTESGD